MKEQTKIVIKRCQECGNAIQILTNETAKIVAIRCPLCFEKFKLGNGLCREHGYLVGHPGKTVRLMGGNKFLP